MASGPPPNIMSMAEQKYDSIGRVKSLVWSVKDALVKVVKVAADDIYHNAAVDNGIKTSDEGPPRVDKCLEDFFSICNQIEVNLRTIQECTTQLKDSQQYLPLPVTIKSEAVGPVEGLSYSQYLSTVKGQVAFAKNIQEMLTDGARRVSQVD